MTRTYEDARTDYFWSLFLKGYHNDDPEARREFETESGMNRAQRRKINARARKLRRNAVKRG